MLTTGSSWQLSTNQAFSQRGGVGCPKKAYLFSPRLPGRSPGPQVCIPYQRLRGEETCDCEEITHRVCWKRAEQGLQFYIV